MPAVTEAPPAPATMAVHAATSASCPCSCREDDLAHALERALKRIAVPRAALRIEEAAESLGVSPDFFKEHVLPHLRVVKPGKGSRRMTLIPTNEIARFLNEESSRVLDDLVTKG